MDVRTHFHSINVAFKSHDQMFQSMQVDASQPQSSTALTISPQAAASVRYRSSGALTILRILHSRMHAPEEKSVTLRGRLKAGPICCVLVEHVLCLRSPKMSFQGTPPK